MSENSFQEKIPGLFLKSAFVFAAIFAIGLFFVPRAEAATWYNTSWGYRNLLTINASQVATSSITSSTYNNFPVLVNFLPAASCTREHWRAALIFFLRTATARRF